MKKILLLMLVFNSCYSNNKIPKNDSELNLFESKKINQVLIDSMDFKNNNLVVDSSDFNIITDSLKNTFTKFCSKNCESIKIESFRKFYNSSYSISVEQLKFLSNIFSIDSFKLDSVNTRIDSLNSKGPSIFIDVFSENDKISSFFSNYEIDKIYYSYFIDSIKNNLKIDNDDLQSGYYGYQLYSTSSWDIIPKSIGYFEILEYKYFVWGLESITVSKEACDINPGGLHLFISKYNDFNQKNIFYLGRDDSIEELIFNLNKSSVSIKKIQTSLNEYEEMIEQVFTIEILI